MLRWIAFLLATLFVFPHPIQAQTAAPPARDAVYLELLGNGVLYTVNYDRRFTDDLTGRVGLGVFGGVAVPVMANYLLGEGRGRLELGAGVVLIGASDVDIGEVDPGEEEQDLDWLAGTATVGYRYQPASGGFVFRIGLTPLFSLHGGVPWLGVSFGRAFR